MCQHFVFHLVLVKKLFVIYGHVIAILNAPTIQEVSDVVKVNQYARMVCYNISTHQREIFGAKYPTDFSRECQDYSQLQEVFDVLQNYKDYMKAIKNNILVKMGTFLNKTNKDVIKKKHCGFCKQINSRGIHSNIGTLWLYMPYRTIQYTSPWFEYQKYIFLLQCLQ